MIITTGIMFIIRFIIMFRRLSIAWLPSFQKRLEKNSIKKSWQDWKFIISLLMCISLIFPESNKSAKNIYQQLNKIWKCHVTVTIHCVFKLCKFFYWLIYIFIYPFRILHFSNAEMYTKKFFRSSIIHNKLKPLIYNDGNLYMGSLW